LLIVLFNEEDAIKLIRADTVEETDLSLLREDDVEGVTLALTDGKYDPREDNEEAAVSVAMILLVPDAEASCVPIGEVLADGDI